MNFLSKTIVIVSALFFLGCSAKDKNASLHLQGEIKDEEDFAYKTFFLPRAIGSKRAYVGDCMPFYEDGVFYVYYLKDGGDSYNHSVFLATTTDFVSWQEIEKPVLESSRTLAQDSWIGTGSVVKIDGEYLFFYTGHAASASEYGEKIMAAKSDNLYSFEKIDGWGIAPDDSLGQKRDFRDPQAYLDVATGRIILTVTACKDGKGRILKYSMDKNLENISYDGIIFTDETAAVYNLECSDTFEMNGFYYLTYSAQDDTHFYAVSQTPYGAYSAPRRLDGKLFYAAKHTEKDGETYLVGWGRRSEEPTLTQEVKGWAGNIVAQKIVQRADGSLFLSPIDAVKSQFTTEQPTLFKNSSAKIFAKSERATKALFSATESFLLEGRVSFSKGGRFGLLFDCADEDLSKFIAINPAENTLSLFAEGGDLLITQTPISLEKNREYAFSYVQEGSLGTFYIEGEASLTVRVYGSCGYGVRFFAEDNAVSLKGVSLHTRE